MSRNIAEEWGSPVAPCRGARASIVHVVCCWKMSLTDLVGMKHRLGGFTAMFVGMLLFMSLLSITHFKQYMKLHLFRLANAVRTYPTPPRLDSRGHL